MTLEAVMICIDNSEHMRNGDFVPSRFDAQHDAVNLVTGAKTNQNMQSCVGVLAMSTGPSRSVEILVNPTNDESQILTSIHKATIGGTVNLSSGLNVARLALKHRENRNQHQRIIAFVGSPIQEDVKDLIKLGKKLKKNNVAVDVVNFGEEVHNTEKLEALINAVNRDDTSHLVTVPPGPHYLSDILVSSTILRHDDGGGGTDMGGGEGGGGGGGSGGGGAFDFGLDPSVDYELAMALRMSAEEHEREVARNAAAEGGGDAAAPAEVTTPVAGGDVAMATGELDEDEEMRLAIEMSLAEAKESEQAEEPADVSAAPEAMPAAEGGDLSDATYVSSVLMSMPGMDSADSGMQDAMQAATKDDDDVDMSKGEGEKQKDKE